MIGRVKIDQLMCTCIYRHIWPLLIIPPSLSIIWPESRSSKFVTKAEQSTFIIINIMVIIIIIIINMMATARSDLVASSVGRRQLFFDQYFSPDQLGVNRSI